MKISDEPKFTVRTKISALWAALLLLYVYADVLSLFRPGQIEEMADGRMGPVEATQATLLLAATIVVIPTLMVFLTLILKAGLCRWTNLVLGVLYTAVNVGNLIGETWAYYLLFGALEIAATALIVWYAWKWSDS
ncbi:MAG: hypothetical protein GEU96_10970 [Propionibacteriales bacterium]|nr:hypothetical protein [Propionibacteriales bacterium]